MSHFNSVRRFVDHGYFGYYDKAVISTIYYHSKSEGSLVNVFTHIKFASGNDFEQPQKKYLGSCGEHLKIGLFIREVTIQEAISIGRSSIS